VTIEPAPDRRAALDHEGDDPAYALVVMVDPDGNEFSVASRPSATTVARLDREERR